VTRKLNHRRVVAIATTALALSAAGPAVARPFDLDASVSSTPVSFEAAPAASAPSADATGTPALDYALIGSGGAAVLLIGAGGTRAARRRRPAAARRSTIAPDHADQPTPASVDSPAQFEGSTRTPSAAQPILADADTSKLRGIAPAPSTELHLTNSFPRTNS
jgi:hypothetical protein